MSTPTTETVEAVVRKHLLLALGGVRGMLEAAIPTIIFTVVFLTTQRLRPAIVGAVIVAFVLLAVRLAQRSTPQFVVNAFVGIGIGALFAYRAARGGGDANDQALAYFLPGIIYNFCYAVLISASILVRWPVVGFMIGAVTGEPTEWRHNNEVVKLCSRLTWLLVLPCVIRVMVQAPLYLAGRNEWMKPEVAVAFLGTAKLAMGWPLQIAALAAMVWLLTRDKTSMESTPASG